MEFKLAKIRIEELKIIINKWSVEYYENDNSPVDDSIYDSNLEELIKLEELFPSLLTLDSPTQNIGSFKNTLFIKRKHNILMQSLKNAFSDDDLFEFDKQINSDHDEYSFYVEPKIDGLSISLHYNKGILERAITRGDGEIGEDVTNNVLQISDIPRKLSIDDHIEIRGEIYLPLSEFERINNERYENDEKLFSNPRNAASGTMRQLDSGTVSKRKLESIMYWCSDSISKKYKWKTQQETIKNLKVLGFKTSSISEHAKEIIDVLSSIKKINLKRPKLNYEIDGIVVKINESSLYESIGYTSKFPKWAVAYKFPAEIKETILLDIFSSVGRTGRITYNAKLSPVEISGSIIQRATLHNADYIIDLDLRIGDTVRIKKAGEIIPKVISFNKDKRSSNSTKWTEDKTCPSCHEKLLRIDEEVDQYCVNINCDSKIKESIIHFCSRDAMNIEGLSIKQIERFVDIGIIKNFSDLYDLYNKKEYLIKLDGYQEKSVTTLIKNIEESKKNNLDKLIFGLGIRHIGKKTAKDISNIFLNIDNIMNASFEDFNNENDFGGVKSNSIVQYFNDPLNIILINNLKNIGLNMSCNKIKTNYNNRFYGKTIVITGSLSGLNREEAKEYFLSLGSKVTSSVTSKTDYLIFGEKGSENKASKIEKNKLIKIKDIEELGV